jgi:hypothetical protein
MSSLLTSDEIIEAMDWARFDPMGQQRDILNKMEEVMDGDIRYCDPTNPAMFLFEAMIAVGAGNMIGMEVLTRKRYASLALTMEDLYLHMADRAYLGIFAEPSMAPIGLMVALEEVRSYAVEVTPGGVRKLVMPKNSSFTVDNTTFTFEYPIEFTFAVNGGLSVVYGTSPNGALHTIASNIINYDVIDYGGTSFIRLQTTVPQMTITSQIFQTNAAGVFNTTLSFTDQFHYARAYVRVTNGAVTSWKEVATTHTDQVFNPSVATVLLQVGSGVMSVRVPIVYQTLGLISGELRIDIYTTKAVNDKILTDFDSKAWSVVWEDLDNDDNGLYTAPFMKISTYRAYSDGYTSGGRAALTLEQVRERVTNFNLGPINLPITNVNREQALADDGYDSVVDVDAITKRVFNATRVMPVPLDKYTLTPISTATESMSLRLADLNGLAGTSHNGDRVTLHPSILYRDLDGGVEIVSEAEKSDLFLLKPEATARAISEADYRFSPFHNVLDATNDGFAMRIYYLDAPQVTARQFVQANPSVQLDLQAASAIVVSRVANGYLIHVKTSSQTLYQGLEDDQVEVQLAYTPPGESDMAYLNGIILTKESGERVWEFNLVTNYDIDSNDSLTLLNFSMFGDGPLNHPIGLAPTFDIIYLVSAYTAPNMKPGPIDELKNRNMLPYDSIGVLHERVTISLGSPLKYLWAGSRTVGTPADYELYADDQFDYYTETTYVEDPVTGGMLITLGDDGELHNTVLHNAGDQIFLADGSPQYKYRKGDLVLVNGEKVLKNPRQLARQIDLTLFDGRYYFANDASSINYMQQICTNMVTWATTDMGATNEKALEKSSIYFKPLATTGQLDAVVGEGADVTIYAEQSLKVLVLMTEVGFKNDDLKTNIRKTIISIIADKFASSSVAIVDISTAVREQSGADVLGLEITGLGGIYNYPLVTLTDGNGRLSIRKKLTSLPDNTYTVEEDIDIVFTPHLPARSQK